MAYRLYVLFLIITLVKRLKTVYINLIALSYYFSTVEDFPNPA